MGKITFIAIGVLPFSFGFGDPEDFLYRKGDQQEILERLAEYGNTALSVQGIRTYGDADYKDNPFKDFNTQGVLDEQVLSQWEQWISFMEQKGIMLFFHFYGDGIRIGAREELNWPLDWKGNLHPQEKYYIETIVNRFKNHDNISWVVMNDGHEMSDWELGTREFVLVPILVLSALGGVFALRKHWRIIVPLGFVMLIGGALYIYFARTEYIRHTRAIVEAIKTADQGRHLIGVSDDERANVSKIMENPDIDFLYLETESKSRDPAFYADLAGIAVSASQERYAVLYQGVVMGKLFEERNFALAKDIICAIKSKGAYPMVLGSWNRYYTNVAPPDGFLEDCDTMESI